MYCLLKFKGLFLLENKDTLHFSDSKLVCSIYICIYISFFESLLHDRLNRKKKKKMRLFSAFQGNILKRKIFFSASQGDIFKRKISVPFLVCIYLPKTVHKYPKHPQMTATFLFHQNMHISCQLGQTRKVLKILNATVIEQLPAFNLDRMSYHNT